MTDVIDGSSGANAQATRKDEGESFSAVTIGNPDVQQVSRILDDVLSADQHPGPADGRDAQALTPTIRPTWASRRMGSPRPVTPETAGGQADAAATQPLPASMLRAAPHLRAAGPGTSAAAQTEMLRVLPPRPPAAAPSSRTAAPPGPTFTPHPAFTPKPTFTPTPAFTATAPPSPKTPPRPAGPDGPVLPVPPGDDEKFQYVRRNAWILTLFSVASFPLLLFSQARLMLQYHWFWMYSPFVVLAALFLALPLLTDGLSRKFDFDEHRRLVDFLAAGRVPVGGRVPAGVRGAGGGAQEHLEIRGGDERALPGDGHAVRARRLA